MSLPIVQHLVYPLIYLYNPLSIQMVFYPSYTSLMVLTNVQPSLFWFPSDISSYHTPTSNCDFVIFRNFLFISLSIFYCIQNKKLIIKFRNTMVRFFFYQRNMPHKTYISISVTLLTFHLLRSPLKDFASSNIPPISLTLLTFHLLRSPLNFVSFKHISHICHVTHVPFT